MENKPKFFQIFFDIDDVGGPETDVSSEGEENPVAQIDSDLDLEVESEEEEPLPLEQSFPEAEQPGVDAVADTNLSDMPGFYSAKDGSRWSQTPPDDAQRHTNFHAPPTKIPETTGVVDPFSAYQLFLTPSIISIIVTCTNAEGKRSLGDAWNDTDEMEIMAFFGCFLLAGAMKKNFQATKFLWNRMYGIKFLQAAFSRKRFDLLSNHLRFDDKTTRSARREGDPFAPIRDLWDAFNKNLMQHYIPGPTLTVDEQLIPWRGRCSFLQHMPSKPDKYGIRIFWICDAETSYPLKGKPYLGKLTQKSETNLGRNTTIELTKPFYESGRNVTLVNFFTDPILAEYLFKNGLTVVGTVKKKNRFVPDQFGKKHLQKGQSIFGFQRHTTLCSYKSGKQANVILMSTMHRDATLIDEKSKPEIVLSYNKTKGGVEAMDQLAHFLTTKRKTRRWPLIVFFNMLDIASIAALVVFREKFPEDEKSSVKNRTSFQVALAEALLSKQIRRRLTQTNISTELRNLVQECIHYLDAVESTGPGSSQSQPPQRSPPSVEVEGARGVKRKRCSECPWKRDRKSTNQCVRCEKYLCNEHVKRMCASCASRVV